jgi:hypothetical protein
MRPDPSAVVALAAREALRAAERNDGALAMALSNQAWRAWVRMQADNETDVEQARLAGEGMDALLRAGLLGKG